MSAPLVQQGAGMPIVIEFLIRDALFRRLTFLAGDRLLMNDFFRRYDSLHSGTQDQWVKDMRTMFTEFVTSAELFQRIMLTYPFAEAHLPTIAIVTENEVEDESMAGLNDDLGRWAELEGTLDPDDATASRVIDHQVRGVGQISNVQVSVWETRPEGARALAAAVHWALFSGKGLLKSAGVRNLAISRTGFEPQGHPLQKMVHFVPLFNVRIEWTWKYTRREGGVPHRITYSPATVSS